MMHLGSIQAALDRRRANCRPEITTFPLLAGCDSLEAGLSCRMSQLSSRLTDLKKWRSLQAAGSVEHVLRTREGIRYTQYAPSLRRTVQLVPDRFRQCHVAVPLHACAGIRVPELPMTSQCAGELMDPPIQQLLTGSVDVAAVLLHIMGSAASMFILAQASALAM